MNLDQRTMGGPVGARICLNNNSTGAAVVATTSQTSDLLYYRSGEGWSVRGVSLPGLTRILCEVDELTTIGEAALHEALASALCAITAAKITVVGRQAAELAALMSLAARSEGAIGGQWTSDPPVTTDLYTEIQYRTTATLDGYETVLLAALTHGLLGRRHHTPLLAAIRHSAPHAYTSRLTVVDADGQYSARVRVGGRPDSQALRRVAIWEVLTAPVDESTISTILTTVQAGLRTEEALGGDRGACALELFRRLDIAITSLGPERSAERAAVSWRKLTWTESSL